MPVVEEIAQVILEGFNKHYRLFRHLSAGAKDRFERGDWAAVRAATTERIGMYDARVWEAVHALKARFPKDAPAETLWPAIKMAYIGLLYDHLQPECAETFFNSVACRVLDRRYYNNDHIFWRRAIATEHLDGQTPTYRSYYPEKGHLLRSFAQVFDDFWLKNPFDNLARDLRCVGIAIREHFGAGWKRHPNFQLQVLSSLFFRNKAAYVVGRAVNGSNIYPFVVPILRDSAGKLYLDSILLERRTIGRVLSLARAYFMVDMEVPAAYVAFLQSLIPSKPKAELYTLLGLQKQGKTLLYRDLQWHLKHSNDRFVSAPGTRGMVMLVFTLPSFPYVFKVIRDWFERPKDTDEAAVAGKYVFVKYHDRVGRMADTLEYSDVAFPRDRFDPELLAELERLVPSKLEKDGELLVIKHLYVERRLVPLDVYLQNAPEPQMRAVIRDYGNALRELAAADVFPGDLLLKNFGVTWHGRVVFYDYDEISELKECQFREIPTARSDAEEMSGEPWFNVGPHDVFPEQFPTFLFPEGKARDIFMEYHADLVTAGFWRQSQDRSAHGILEDVFPYPQEVRFCRRYLRKCPETRMPSVQAVPATAAP